MAGSISPPSTRVIERARNASVFFRLKQGSSTVAALVLPLKPSRLQMVQASRVQTTQVLGGVYYDDFGFGVPTVSLEGHTGWFASSDGAYWSPSTGRVSPIDGPTAYEYLYSDIYLKYFEMEAASTSGDPQVYLELVSTFDQIDWYVKPVQDFALTRDRANPMVFQYTVSFSMVRDRSGLVSLVSNTSPAQSSISFSQTPPTVIPSTPIVGTSSPSTQGTAASSQPAPLPSVSISTVTTGSPQQQESAVQQSASRIFNLIPSAPEPNGTEEVYSYTVQSGDTLWSIIQQFYGTVTSQLISEVVSFSNTDNKYISLGAGKAAANQIVSPSLIYVGETIYLPQRLGNITGKP